MVPIAVALWRIDLLVATCTFSALQKAIMIILHQPATDENRQSAKTHLDEVLLILAKPGGYAKLSPTQRKFIVGITLAAIIPADKRIRSHEEQMVDKVADLSSVPRKKVVELMARAAARA